MCSTPLPLYPQGNNHGSYWMGGWLVPTAILDARSRKQIFASASNRIAGVHVVTHRYLSSHTELVYVYSLSCL